MLIYSNIYFFFGSMGFGERSVRLGWAEWLCLYGFTAFFGSRNRGQNFRWPHVWPYTGIKILYVEAWLSLVERCVRDAEVARSNLVASTILMWRKRYYAHKRLCKAICGHKSCEKQKSQSVDIFDTKMDSNHPPTKFSSLFLYKSHKAPTSDFLQSGNKSQVLFYW